MEKGKGGEREREKKMKKGTERIKKGEKNVERARLSTTWVDFRWMTLVTMVIWRRPWRKCEHEGCVIGDSPSETSWQQAQVHGRLSSILPRSYLFIFFSFFFKNFIFFPRVIFCPTTARCQDTQAETCCTCSGRHAPPPGSSLGSIHRIFSSGFLPALPSFIRRESDPTRRPGSDARARVKRKNQREKKQTNKQKWPKKSATH